MATVVIKIMRKSSSDPTKLSRQSWTQVPAVAKGVLAIGVEEVAVVVAVVGVEEVGYSFYNTNIMNGCSTVKL